MDHRRAWLHRISAFVLGAVVLSSCALRAGVITAGTVRPPSGALLVETFVAALQSGRRDLPLPPIDRDPALDDLARNALQAIEAGMPNGVAAADHVDMAAKLPDELIYDVDFEENTPGLDAATLDAGRHKGGIEMPPTLIAADPALVAVGAAASGPWSVAVLRTRRLASADTGALQAALEGHMRIELPKLQLDQDLQSIAADALADGAQDQADFPLLARAGGVPVTLIHSQSGHHLPTLTLAAASAGAGSVGLDEAWLTRAGVGVKITDGNRVLFTVLATGEADRNALQAELDAAAAGTATDMVNRARAEAALPPVTKRDSLVDAAKRWVIEAGRRGCYVGFDSQPDCQGRALVGQYRWHANHMTWMGPRRALTFTMAPTDPGDDQLKWFGAAAALAPDGTVWAAVALSS